MSELKASCITELDINNLELEYRAKSPQDILKFALEQFDNIAISFSGAEDIVLIDMASRIGKNFQVFSIDTGRLHPETYQFLDKVRKHYCIKLDVVFPEPTEVESLVREKGLFSFYEDNHKECCGIRKVRPLRRQLSTLNAWITGQRHDQNPSTRANIPVIQIDTAFSIGDRTLIKFNPLANWSSVQVWQYIQSYNVPYNQLHTKGFISIGCEPCTRAILPNQHERQGRWWWEDASEKECGFHGNNNMSQNGFH
ncbi:phosphoadenylyl-sulfate reductase [Nostoc sp. ATCC 53789]|uniref:phosphoadenylyl-sulfate reductase n=1 Tax=Nostoc sp. ATCC 53789 TaxID=76335 RepID=UPI000DECFD00|nr:phosphoadenylyl-sulfate reductase [Nostoc sp. ATCC 53789]QHG21101.1 phosphoadenylyl-sulfate reductase [Nostoc sp. ATCC 53789]RCJ17006.1 phosphoadenosine phosphosulfate reductase [Nostoc sp. ATCC 53789]